MYNRLYNILEMNSGFYKLQFGFSNAKMRCYWIYGEGGSECSGLRIFKFFIKENWICAMT